MSAGACQLVYLTPAALCIQESWVGLFFFAYIFAFAIGFLLLWKLLVHAGSWSDFLCHEAGGMGCRRVFGFGVSGCLQGASGFHMSHSIAFSP